jgi:dihydropyrimidinase
MLGRRNGRIGLERFVDLTAANPARLYGLYPRKGCIQVGSDADLAAWDPEREVTVTQGVLHDRMDYTPFEGMVVRGWPVVTISRGEVIWMGGEVRGEAGRGRFVRRTGSPPPPLER